VPHAALQLLPGCIPPPAAFFLVEQLLRGGQSAASLSLAVKLLRGSVAVLSPAAGHHHCQQQQQQQQADQQQADGSPPNPAAAAAAGSTELARLAYCSLAASVVQVAAGSQEELGSGCVGELLTLAAELAQAAAIEASSSNCGGGGGKDSGSRGISSSCHSHSTGADTALRSSTSSSSGSSSSAPGCAKWGVAASLAAAVAANAYCAHLQLQAAAAALGGQAQQLHGRAPAGEEPEAGDSSSQAAAAGSTCISSSGENGCTSADVRRRSSSSTAEAGSCGGEGDQSEATATCLEGCCNCSSAIQLITVLSCLERGKVIPSISRDAAVSSRDVLLQSAQLHGLTLQDHLQQLLATLAMRYPVPGVCGNVLCGRLEEQTAVGGVHGCVGTMCGRCRAAWYCCERCQRVAWPVHSHVCRAAIS
jgi:hypothetical protein